MSSIRSLYRSFSVYAVSFTKSNSVVICPGVLYAYGLYPKFTKNRDTPMPLKTALLNANYAKGRSST